MNHAWLFCAFVFSLSDEVQTLARGGHVLVPTNPCGLLFDLLETAIRAKENFNGTLTRLFPTELADPAASVPGSGSVMSAGNGSSNAIGTGNNTTSSGTATTTSGPVGSSDAVNGVEVGTGQLVGGGSSLAARVARCPVYTIAGQIHASLAYANAYGEWLNSEKESLLYTADSPFPYQTLLRSGQLIAVRSLHETPMAKDLSTSLITSVSPIYGRSSPPLLGGLTNGQTQSPDSHSVSSIPGNTLPTTGAAGTPSSTGLNNGLASFPLGTRESQPGLSGGSWPATPCLIFATHPSLRFGPVVHLLRALAYAAIKPGGRATQNSQTPRHAVVLVESNDYVQR
ncbi:unnamed protein product [Echinostoma caproni]|uniref:Secreted protein n=1 Tax=Echinostoma caproni TaxID=27848 RepID=A0A183B7I3_9TREM|nr:unnamed protein product [Echinostoma caproni]